VDAVVRIGDARPVAVRDLQVGHGPAQRDQELGEWYEVGGAVRVEQYGIGAWRQRVAAGIGGAVGIVHREDPGSRLLFRPLTGITRVDVRSTRQLRCGHAVGPGGGESLVQTQPGAQVDGEGLEGAETSGEELVSQSLGGAGGGLGRGHDAHLSTP
jgi:hypothetical protein